MLTIVLSSSPAGIVAADEFPLRHLWECLGHIHDGYAAEYFIVMSFDVKDSKVLNYMGTKSGRDGDHSATQGDACPDKKAQALGLHTAYTANGTPYYTEATMVIECRMMYAAPFDPQGFKSDVPFCLNGRFALEGTGKGVNKWLKLL